MHATLQKNGLQCKKWSTLPYNHPFTFNIYQLDIWNSSQRKNNIDVQYCIGIQFEMNHQN